MRRGHWPRWYLDARDLVQHAEQALESRELTRFDARDALGLRYRYGVLRGGIRLRRGLGLRCRRLATRCALRARVRRRWGCSRGGSAGAAEVGDPVPLVRAARV